MSTSLALGRASFAKQQWKSAYDGLLAADSEQPLEPEDLERLAAAAHLTGNDAIVGAIWTRAHQGHLKRNDIPRAARCAFWLALPLIMRGEHAQGGGWLARATRMLDDGNLECVERGYILFARGLSTALGGDPTSASGLFAESVAVGERYRDMDLIAYARHGHGRALIGMGEIGAGAALLDEAMAAILSGEVSPMMAGDVYCSLIDACHDMLDIRRAQEWTAALDAWCANQPELTPYRGQCLVHRAEIMTIHGAWPGASEEAERARDCLSQPPPHRAMGAALYQIGELHRLRGDFSLADEAYRNASRAGRDPQPGLALLRLAQGQTEAAMSAIARAMQDPGLRRRRSWILPAFVEIALAVNDLPAARTANDTLARVATANASPYLRALSANANGAVLLAEGNATGALAALRLASGLWVELDAPYEAARTRVLIGLACRTLGDNETGALELDGARAQLEALGAAADVVRVWELMRDTEPSSPSVLTRREVEVLRLVGTGKTNRSVAVALGISEKTVARHVSNIFTKLGLSSRAAATAYAYENGFLARRT